jgi:hypothetical protein
MFAAKKNMQAQEVRSTHDALIRTLAAQDTWFDGTLASIANRRSELQRAANLVRRAISSGEHMAEAALFLDRETKKLEAMESRIITEASFPASERQTDMDISELCVAGRRFISTHIDSFLADNINESDPDEIADRAENYAEIGTIQLPSTEAKKTVEAFISEVLRKVSSRKERTVAREASVDIESLPDDILFM